MLVLYGKIIWEKGDEVRAKDIDEVEQPFRNQKGVVVSKKRIRSDELLTNWLYQTTMVYFPSLKITAKFWNWHLAPGNAEMEKELVVEFI